MKYVLGFIVIIALHSFCLIDDIYSLPVKTIEGKNIDLGNYKGRKILFVTLPSSASDSSVSSSNLSALAMKFKSALVIIGVPDKETGSEDQKESFKKRYAVEQDNFVLAEGAKVDNKQSPLFQWLTSKDKNGHFDQANTIAGQKFFVDEAGELYAVMGEETKLDDAVTEKILGKMLVKE